MNSNTGVYKFQIKSDVIVGGITTDEPVIEKMSIAYDGTAINAKLSAGTSYADDDAMLEAVKDYINANVSGYTAEVDVDFAGEKIGLVLKNSAGQTKDVAKGSIKAQNNLLVIKVDTADVVLSDNGTAETVAGALKLAGIKLSDANIHVILTAGTAAGKPSTSTDAVGTTATKIDTNSGKGYAKMDTTGAYTATQTSSVGNNAVWTVVKNDGETKIINDGSNDYLPIGVAVELKVSPQAKVNAVDNGTGITFNAGTCVNCTITAETTTAFASGDIETTDTAIVKVTVTGADTGAAKIVLTPANVVVAP